MSITQIDQENVLLSLILYLILYLICVFIGLYDDTNKHVS